MRKHVPFPTLDAILRAEGYLPSLRAPGQYTLLDGRRRRTAEACAGRCCPGCARQGLDYIPYVGANGTDYRAVGVCPVCDAAIEL